MSQAQESLRFGGAAMSALLAVLSFGCSSDKDRAPIQACGTNGDICDPANRAGSGGPGDSGTGGGDAGVETDAGVGTLTGSVLIYAGDDFATTARFAERATIRGYGPGGTRVDATWDGVNPFALSGLELAPQNWISVVPQNVTSPALTTLHPVATDRFTALDLPVVRAQTLDEIFSVLTQPVERLPERAQAVLFFVDSSTNLPISGLSVQVAQAERVAYADSGWTDDDLARTSNQGLVVAANIVADGDPGSLRAVTVGGAISGSFEIRVAANAVTVVDIRVSR